MHTDINTGLTSQEVAKAIKRGEVNYDVSPKSKTIPQIFATNLFTLFNLINLILALLVFITGEYRNMLFFIIVVINAAIGIFQEIKAKRAVDKLSLLADDPVKVLRDGEICEVIHAEIVLGDIVILSHGRQISCDCEVVEGSCFVNESMLTGESRSIEKKVGDLLLSGSYVSSGACKAEATAVGENSFVSKINLQAKSQKRIKSQIRKATNMVVSIGTYALIPIGLLLFAHAYAKGLGFNASILSMVAAVIGMIPQGLVLLISSVLALSTYRLTKENVLVQQLYCIEQLARVNVICLDKTGTITSGKMQVNSILPYGNINKNELLKIAYSIMYANREDANETASCVLNYGKSQNVSPLSCKRAVPFSSANKYSAFISDDAMYVAGAHQFIFKNLPIDARDIIDSLDPCFRTISIAKVDDFADSGEIRRDGELLGFIVIQDEIRSGAMDTIKYFESQGVCVNVISGDDPKTASAIASAVNISNSDMAVDASSLKTDQELSEAASKYHVFGRVTPEQKKKLIRALKAAGNTVAMTGDGVNDVPALKEADCSCAMASGSDAAKTVAELVLVDNDFSHLPYVVDEGRRSINNLERSSSLFLVKTIYSILVGLLCVFFPPYPFLPIQLSLISATLIGIPSFALALESNFDRVNGTFLRNVMLKALPAAIAITFSLCAVVLLRSPMSFDRSQISSMCTVLVSISGFTLLYHISKPFNKFRTTLFVLMLLMESIPFFLKPDFFHVAKFTLPMYIVVGILAAISFTILILMYNRTGSKDSSLKGV